MVDFGECFYCKDRTFIYQTYGGHHLCEDCYSQLSRFVDEYNLNTDEDEKPDKEVKLGGLASTLWICKFCHEYIEDCKDMGLDPLDEDVMEAGTGKDLLLLFKHVLSTHMSDSQKLDNSKQD